MSVTEDNTPNTKAFLRRDLDTLAWCKAEDPLPEHPGLAYQRLAPCGDDGKVPDKVRGAWLEKVAGILKSDTPCSRLYRDAYARWKSTFEDGKSVCTELTLASRLLVGHGGPSATDVGLTLQHTYGVPMIPGSALKGLLAHYLEACYGPESADERHPMDPTHPEAARAAFQGVKRDTDGKRLKHGPGALARQLFGAPPTDEDDHARDDFGREDVGPTAGMVIFHDAWMMPPAGRGESPLAVDVLTVHQKSYYDAHMGDSSSGKGVWPNDYDSPNPVGFLSVRPGTRFLVVLSGELNAAKFAMTHLQDALIDWGVGGKTAAGYGRFKGELSAHSRGPTEAGRGVAGEPGKAGGTDAAGKSVLEDFKRWLAAQVGNDKDILNSVKGAKLGPLTSLDADLKAAAADLISKRFKNPAHARLKEEILAALK